MWDKERERGRKAARTCPSSYLHAGRFLAGSPGRAIAGEALPLAPRRLDERLDGRRTVVSRLLRSLAVPAGVALPLVVVIVELLVVTFPVGEALGMGRRLLRRPLAIALAGRVGLGRLGVC